MKILLLFGLFPHERADEIVRDSKYSVQYAADALQWGIIRGLNENNINYHIINLPFIGSFPRYYSKLYSDSYNICTNNLDLSNGKNVSFCNLRGYKNISRYFQARVQLNKWLKSQNKTDTTTIIVYSLHLPFIKAAIDLKKIYSDLRICIIVPDLPQFMSDNSSIIYQACAKINRFFLERLIKRSDYFVFLSKYMPRSLNIVKQPFSVVEGISPIVGAFHNCDKSSDKSTKTIFYSGTLAVRYGVLNLVEAFIKFIPNENYRLIICGEGDAKYKIINAASNDNRIEYKGQLEHNIILKLQEEADLLVNPRTPEGVYTKYSFPSKTMEYFASGTPTLIYKLDGIPEEYYDYCFTLEENDGVQQLAAKIKEIFSMDYEKLKVKGRMAQDFVLNQKNAKVQVKKIIDLIN